MSKSMEGHEKMRRRHNIKVMDRGDFVTKLQTWPSV